MGLSGQGGCTLGREECLEALLLLYQECCSPELMKIQHVANFVNKCKHALETRLEGPNSDLPFTSVGLMH